MKYVSLGIILLLCTMSCAKDEETRISASIEGTWKMVYAEMIENDSLKTKDLNATTFIKIINTTHFAFFNQNTNSSEAYYSGAGTYSLKGNEYTETLNFTTVDAIRNHQFPFTVEIKNDTLIQFGTELVKEAGIDRKIVEKYVRLK